MDFKIQYSTEAAHDIRGMRAYDRSIILESIAKHLPMNPATPSGSRIKRMSQPYWSQFRLRVGQFRVYYDVNDAERIVNILRVLYKGTAPTPMEPA